MGSQGDAQSRISGWWYQPLMHEFCPTFSSHFGNVTSETHKSKKHLKITQQGQDFNTDFSRPQPEILPISPTL
jgi:hypothetical protein